MKSKNTSNTLDYQELQPLDIKKFIPKYKKHIDNNVLIVNDNLMIGFKVFGSPFKAADDEILTNSFQALVRYFTFIGKDFGSRLSIWSSIIKRKDKLHNSYDFDNIFIERFSKDYLKRFDDLDFYKTEYYFTLSLKINNLEDTMQDILSLLAQTQTIIKEYEGIALSVREVGNNSAVSDLATYIASIVNGGVGLDVPLCANDFSDYMIDSEIFANYDYLELRNKSNNTKKYAVCYDLKGYPANTSEAMWDFILDIRSEFVLTQSFNYVTAQKSIKTIEQQENKLGSVGDSSLEFSDELTVGKALLQEGLMCLINYHSSLVVYGQTAKDAINKGLKMSSDFIASGGGVKWERATYDCYQSFFSHMPLSKYRPNASLRSSINFICSYSFHNYYAGKPKGNPIGNGEAILPLKTEADGLYYFNSHYSELYKDSVGQKVSGHALILGATGFGKTTLEATIIGFLQRFNPKMFVIDYNRSTELYLRAFGGEYFTLTEGEYTGLNPFQLENNPSERLKSFLYKFVHSCAKDQDGKLADSDKKILNNAVDTVLELPLEVRKFGLLLQSIPDGDLHIRLEKWCTNLQGVKGDNAWAIDSPENTFNPHNFNKIGFDTTVILRMDNEVTEAVLAILFFYKELMQKKGQLLLTVIEEFHKPCNFPLTAKPIETSLKVGRLMGEFVYLISQSPNDALKCSISTALKEQTQVKILLGNPAGTFADYEAIGITKKEFEIIKKFKEEDRKFLIKQGLSSTVAKLDLSDCLYYLPIISGSREGITVYENLVKETGSDPNIWSMKFLEAMENQRKNQHIKKIT